MTTHTPSRIDDPERWRKRAAEIRRRADEMAQLPIARESLIRTAEEYERWAQQEEERLKATQRPSLGGNP
jgi:hypothetical protein